MSKPVRNHGGGERGERGDRPYPGDSRGGRGRCETSPEARPHIMNHFADPGPGLPTGVGGGARATGVVLFSHFFRVPAFNYIYIVLSCRSMSRERSRSRSRERRRRSRS